MTAEEHEAHDGARQDVEEGVGRHLRDTTGVISDQVAHVSDVSFEDRDRGKWSANTRRH